MKLSNKTKLLFFSPLIIVLEMYYFTWITDLLSQPADIAVLAGIALSCGFITGNFYLIKFLTKKPKTKL